MGYYLFEFPVLPIFEGKEQLKTAEARDNLERSKAADDWNKNHSAAHAAASQDTQPAPVNKAIETIP